MRSSTFLLFILFVVLGCFVSEGKARSKSNSQTLGKSQTSKSKKTKKLKIIQEEEGDIENDFFDQGMSLNKRILSGISHLPDKQVLKKSVKKKIGKAFVKTRKALREIKGIQSSEFERALLKGTRPNEEVKEKHVVAIIDAIAAFQLVMNERSETDYYKVVLHKVWSRMTEKDWRTKAKALYILHRIAVSIDANDHFEFMKRFNRLRGMEHRVSHTRYFSQEPALILKKGVKNLRIFMLAYADFVLDRFSRFNGQFSMNESSEGQCSIGDKLHFLSSAIKVMDRALEMKLSGISSPLPLHCLQLVVCDCFGPSMKSHEPLWSLYCETLSEVLTEQDLSMPSRAEAKTLQKVCEWAQHAPSRINDWLADCNQDAVDLHHQRLPILSVDMATCCEDLVTNYFSCKEEHISGEEEKDKD